MLPLTLNVPNDLAERLRPLGDHIPRILELGLREYDAITQLGYEGAADVLEFLAGLPTPEEILALRPSPALQARIRTLLTKSRTQALTPAQELEWE